MEITTEVVQAALAQLRLPEEPIDPRLRETGAAALMTALGRFAELLPLAERPDASPALSLLENVASTNAFEPLRQERALPVTVLFYAAAHPSYYEGDDRIGAAPWRIAYTDGGAVGPEKRLRDRLLDEAIRLAEAMHDKNPFGEVPFDGGKSVFLQEGAAFQAVTALYGDVGMPRFILAKGGIRYYALGSVETATKQDALRRWAASSALAGVLAHRYIGGPDMRMGEEEMAWVDAAAAEIGAARRVRQHPAVTGLAADAGGFPHQAWELTGRGVAASLKEALRHPGMRRYGLDWAAPIRVLIQGFGDVGGSVARLLSEESPEFAFRIAGVADEHGAIYRAEGLDVAALLRLRAARRPVVEYAGDLDALWAATPPEPCRRASGVYRGTDGRELIFEEADLFIPAAIPNVIDAANAPRLRVRLVAEGANNAVAPRVEELLHARGILYLPGQALNWGGVKSSTLEALFRELTKRAVPIDAIEERVREALAPVAGAVDVGWALELLRSGLSRPPLDPEETRALATAILEDLARSNTRWLMNELVASRYERPPLELVRTLSRTVRALKVQLLSLIESGLGAEFFAHDTSLQRMRCLLGDRLKELLSDRDHPDLTPIQVIEQRQMLQQLQTEVGNGLSPLVASLLAALDLARQKVMDPDGYTQESLRRDLVTLRRSDAPALALEESLYRLQRVHPGPGRARFAAALIDLLQDGARSPILRRNAALALARLGSADSRHRAALLNARRDPDPSVRAACRWALYQMAIALPETTGEPHR
jgi:glutamate dehydrogenase/leucine dehydrogenase